MQDGLVSNPIRCIYQDTKGFIWIGTFEGLSRYDGYKFINYTTDNGLSNNFINSFFEIGNKLLVAENNGAVDEIKSNAIQKRKMSASAVNHISTYRNRILFTTDEDGFYEYKNDMFVLVPQEKPGTSLGDFIPLNDSLILTAGVDHKLFIYNNVFRIYASLKKQGYHFYTLFRDSKNRFWAGTSHGLKLIEIELNKKEVLSFATLPFPFNFSPLSNAPVTSIIEEKDGSFWIGTLRGLVHLFPEGSFYIYNEKDGLPSAIINTLYKDKEENIWIGTASGLAKWVAKNIVVFYNTEQGEFKNDVNSIFLSGNKKIILQTNHGLQYFDLNNREFKNIKAHPKFYLTPVSGSFPLLIHYADKIVRLDSGKNIVVPAEKLDSILTGVILSVRHPDGTIFLGSFSGLYEIKKSSIKKIMPYRITCLAVANNGKIWAGTWERGLFRIGIKNNSLKNYEVQDMTSTTEQKHIRSIYADSKHNIWVGTRYQGAFRLTEKSDGHFETQHFNRQTGLMSDWVNGFAEKKNGDMWVGTYLGLDKLIKEPLGYRIFNFSKAVNFFAEIKNIVSPNDKDWFCVANTGMAYFRDDELDKTPPLQATILSASMGVLENKWTILSPTEKISLNPNQNAARFEFSAPGFLNEKQVLYTYRLKGADDTTWSKPENIHETSYARLPAGNYSFEVKTIGWNGQPGNTASFSFFIRTSFWKQWWFIGLGIIAIAILFYKLYRYRISQLMRLQHVRNSIATDLHDEIGSSLTNISILAELSRKKNQLFESPANLPSRIIEESTRAQQALDDIIWSVNSNNDNLNQTVARMRRYIAEVFESVGINCIIDSAYIPDDFKLDMEQRKDIYLVFKECLNNIIKHAGAKNVHIKIDVTSNRLHLKIEDDGKGFDPLQQTERNGLKSIKWRLQKWNGKMSIKSFPGGGTVIESNFPLVSLK